MLLVETGNAETAFAGLRFRPDFEKMLELDQLLSGMVERFDTISITPGYPDISEASYIVRASHQPYTGPPGKRVAREG